MRHPEPRRPPRPPRGAVMCFLREEEAGTTAVEYAVMLALVLAACIAGISTFGDSTVGVFGKSDTQMEAAGL